MDSAILSAQLPSSFPRRIILHCRTRRCMNSWKNGGFGREAKLKGILGEKMVMMGLSASLGYGYSNEENNHNNKPSKKTRWNAPLKAEVTATSRQEGKDEGSADEAQSNIVERRDLISSIKKSITSAEQVLSDSPELNTSLSNLEVAESDGDNDNGVLDRKFDSGIFSDKLNAPRPPTSVSVALPFCEEDFAQEQTADMRDESVNVHTQAANDYHIKEAFESEGLRDLLDEVIEEPKTPSKDKDSKPPPLAGQNVMNVILVAAECAPWSKTGGLGDVAGALPKALARRGHRVMVVAPKYGDYREAQYTGVTKRYNVAGQDIEVGYHQCYIDGVDFVFIDNNMFHHNAKDIYGGDRLDILKRMVLFCKVAVEVPWHVPCGGVCYGDGNLVFIANDWHTALLPVYLKAYYRDYGLMKYTRSVLVIHNIAHQGRGPVDDFSMTGLPEHYLDLFRLYDPVGGEHLNIFAAGIKTADQVVTVSHGYAWELKTSEGGWGLHGIINENDRKLRGIVNGIDMNDWNPLSDIHLQSDGYTNYALETLETGKAQCKAALQRELGLPVHPDVPLIGFIGRLDYQKGVDLIAEVMPWMVNQDLQLVMLGTGRHDLENMLRQFESQYRDKVRGWVGFSVKMAHRITAGSDILLMPSRFEPCGLNQLYAMVYGTVPVVHAVGGLRDTVQPFDPFSNTGLGWTFERAEAGQLIHALGNCLWTFRDYKDSWVRIQRRGMMQDLSWDHAAEIYEEVLVAAKYQW